MTSAAQFMSLAFMGSFGWYAHRLSAMTPGECARRLRGQVRDIVDRWLRRVRARGAELRAFARLAAPRDGKSPARLLPDGPALGSTYANQETYARWIARQVRRADRAALHRVSFFHLDDCFLGDPIRWNYEHEAGRTTPMTFAPTINYRDYDVTGDARVVWEPNRHHQVVVLARAYQLTGDLRYARAAVAQIESWIAECPFGLGMNWRSPLELAIRLINWVWAFDLLRTSGALTAEFLAKLLPCVHRHLWEITRKYSYGSSANNHLIGEAAAVFIASSYFSDLRDAARWRAAARAILNAQILDQTFADGCTREHALGYQLFVMQFLSLAAIVARAGGDDFSPEYSERLERMFEFLTHLSEGGERVPSFGDSDDGYVLDLGAGPPNAAALLGVGAVLFGRSDFAAAAGATGEAAYALWGDAGAAELARLAGEAGTGKFTSHAFTDSGYYLLQCGAGSANERLSVFFDCGDLGLGSLAAHGHADALSFTLRAFGQDVFVDPGTFDYFRYPEWRRYFRGTRAHNTITVDGVDQSKMLGPFLWGRRARGRCLHWSASTGGATITAEHDGYLRLREPVLHRRALTLNGTPPTIEIHDELTGRGSHEVAAHFHLAEHCRTVVESAHAWRIDCPNGRLRIEFDPRLVIETVTAGARPNGGWVSRSYHQKTPSTTFIGRARMTEAISLVTRIFVAG